MAFLGFFWPLMLLVLRSYCCLSSAALDTLKQGSSLSVKKYSNDVLVSNNGVFTAGFVPAHGNNAFYFAIWLTTKSATPTVVWTVNRDEPVNGKHSKLSLLTTGNLILLDAGQNIIWSTDTSSFSPLWLQLHDTGNLVLHNNTHGILWQSFDSPTDTLLPHQILTKDKSLVSSTSRGNFSSGSYKLYFDNDNVLHLLYQNPEVSSRYWPPPWQGIYAAGRFGYSNNRSAVLDSTGHFTSSDSFEFDSSDSGIKSMRRLTLDSDGNLRLYSLPGEMNETWIVSWQSYSDPCRAHGVCGPNSACSNDPALGRWCSCLPGYRFKNPSDWSSGCEPEFDLSSCNRNRESRFLRIPRLEFYGSDEGYFRNYTFKECQTECSNSCSCKGFQFKYDEVNNFYVCYTKGLLYSGHVSPSFDGDMYLKLPKCSSFSINNFGEIATLDCTNTAPQNIQRNYAQPEENQVIKYVLWFVVALGTVEMIFTFLGCCLMIKVDRNYESVKQRFVYAGTGFKRFTYAELKKATRGFVQEIGRGGGGVVYKGKLSDQRVAAIKRLDEVNGGEAEFLAEISTIGRLNHMNLAQIWGYFAEGKHRLLVYEFMEKGSLADNLCSGTLKWDKRIGIALGVARGLCYLHDECLEWVLHCDIKPQNILLDADYQPKVSDFGLSKLLKRGSHSNLNFSRIRGTRGYMAPEWVYNLPITSKVDVYSYGIVLLEMVTGKSPTAGIHGPHDEGDRREHRRLVTWVKEKMEESQEREAWIGEIIDPLGGTDYDMEKIEAVVKVALLCVDEEMDARPTMKQVVEMLHPKEDDIFLQ